MPTNQCQKNLLRVHEFSSSPYHPTRTCNHRCYTTGQYSYAKRQQNMMGLWWCLVKTQLECRPVKVQLLAPTWLCSIILLSSLIKDIFEIDAFAVLTSAHPIDGNGNRGGTFVHVHPSKKKPFTCS